MPLIWYVLRSKPNKESFLADQLQIYGIEVFFPVLHVKPVNPRSRKIRPFFPNYIFVHVDFDDINVSNLQWMPGASDLVSFDGEPASVPDLLIAAVKRQVDQHNAHLRDERSIFKRGDRVAIQDGPFAGYEAVFDTQLSGQDRVRVLLSLLQNKQLPVEIEGRQIKNINRT